MQSGCEIARGNSQNLLKTVAANSYLFKRVQQGRHVGMFLYGVSFVYDVGLGRPEEKPSTLEPLPVWLRELTGKLGWMKWEPVSLTGGGCQVRGGGHRLSVFYRGGVVSGCSAKAEKKRARRWRKGARRAGQE